MEETFFFWNSTMMDFVKDNKFVQKKHLEKNSEFNIYFPLINW